MGGFQMVRSDNALAFKVKPIQKNRPLGKFPPILAIDGWLYKLCKNRSCYNLGDLKQVT